MSNETYIVMFTISYAILEFLPLFQSIWLPAIILLTISLFDFSINCSMMTRNELDEICCPITVLNRSKTVGMLWNPNGPPQNFTYLYQDTRYKQFLQETLCQFPDTDVPEYIRNDNSRCDGRCQQLHGTQLMITIHHSPLSYTLAHIDIKTGCTFISNNIASN